MHIFIQLEVVMLQYGFEDSEPPTPSQPKLNQIHGSTQLFLRHAFIYENLFGA